MAKISKPAILSKTIQFLVAGGITMVAGVVQEVVKAQPDWGVVSTMIAGIVITLVGGTYGRVVAQGPIRTIVSPPLDPPR